VSVVRRIEFEYLGGLSVDIVAADVTNPLFQLLSRLLLGPLTLAAELGRLSEERAEKALRTIYAQAVVVGSITPELSSYSHEQWDKWLLEHPIEFATIRSIAESPENFVDEDE